MVHLHQRVINLEIYLLCQLIYPAFNNKKQLFRKESEGYQYSSRNLWNSAPWPTGPAESFQQAPQHVRPQDDYPTAPRVS